MSPHYDIDTQRNYSIAIVGGGIGGLCAAIGLLKEGINVQIYEAASQFSEIGAGVSLGPNAARALKSIDPALHRGFEKVRTNNAWPEKQKYWFTFRIGDDRSGSEYGKRFFDLYCETGQSSVHRARFLDELVALVPEEIAHFGKKLVCLEEGPDFATLKFADGTTATHSAVIGCDGVKSITRQFVLGPDNPATNPTFTGKYAYRGLIPMDSAAAILGDELARNSQQYLGHGGHVLTFPIVNGETMNVVAFGSKNDGEWEGEWQKPMDKEAMMSDFEGWIEPVQKILGMMQKSDVWALFDHPPAETYVSNGGRVVMLGDAAHASTPHNGAGAGMAVEDALILSRVLGCVYDSRDLVRAFHAYDAVRRPRSQHLVKQSRLNGLVYDLQAPGIGDDLEKVKQHLSNRAWLWDRDLEKDVREAERLFRGEEEGSGARL